MSKIIAYARLMRFDKPIGTLLLLWPTLWGLWIASAGHPQPLILLIFVLGAILMRAAGCCLNDIADRHLDGKVKRTANRPLVTGELTVMQAFSAFVITSLSAFALVLLTNRLTVLFAVIGLLLAIIYPFLKRYTHLPQAWLGIAFSWGVPLAFTAQTQQLPAAGCWLLFIAAVIWCIVYDTFYAMVDREDDLKAGIKSTAVLFAKFDRIITARLQLSVLLLLIFFGFIQSLNGWYYLGLLCAAIFMGYQQYLIKDREPSRCFRAFLNNNWVGMVIFLGIVLNYILR